MWCRKTEALGEGVFILHVDMAQGGKACDETQQKGELETSRGRHGNREWGCSLSRLKKIHLDSELLKKTEGNGQRGVLLWGFLSFRKIREMTGRDANCDGGQKVDGKKKNPVQEMGQKGSESKG